MDDRDLPRALRSANRAMRSLAPAPTLEQKRRMWRNIQNRIGRDYFIWGFAGGLLAGASAVLLLKELS